MAPAIVSAENASYCYLDIDIDHYRWKWATAAAFCKATDTRYGFSSSNLLDLGGSEVSRLSEAIVHDHEWASKNQDCGGIQLKAPDYGSRIVIQLYWEIAPLACENFALLCSNGKPVPLPLSSSTNTNNTNTTTNTKAPPMPIGTSGKALTFSKSIFHRIIPGFVAQGGDFVFGNGSGGESALPGKTKFKDEKAGLFTLKHDAPGLVSMGNSGKNSNSSQFFFTLGDATPQCDGKHVIFGRIVSGMKVVRAMEEVGRQSDTEVPSAPVTITDCGIYTPFIDPGAGVWFDQPDEESYSGISPIFLGRPRVALVVPNATVGQRFTAALGSTKVSVESIVPFDSTTTATNDDQSTDETTVINKITNALTSFSVDVILVAPACKSIVSRIQLPPNNNNNNNNNHNKNYTWRQDLKKTILVAKPVEALSKILTESWLADHCETWHLGR